MGFWSLWKEREQEGGLGKKSIRKERKESTGYSAGLRKAKGEFPSKEIHERSPAWGINGLALVPLPCTVSLWEHPSGSMVSECVTWLIWGSKSQCLSANDPLTPGPLKRWPVWRTSIDAKFTYVFIYLLYLVILMWYFGKSRGKSLC